MGLSVLAIKAAQGQARPYKLADTDGLYLMVSPIGQRYWRMNYRFRGKQRTLSFGKWPDVGLADARERRDAARRLLANKIDPSVQAKLDRIAADVAASNTFRSVADEWIAKGEKEGLSRDAKKEPVAACLCL